MSQIIVKLDCPHCFSTKVVKNVKKTNGSQNYLCQKCKKQFQHEYLYWGANIKIKRQILSLLVHGNGVNDIVHTLGVSKGCVLRTLIKNGSEITIEPSKKALLKSTNRRTLQFCSEEKKESLVIVCL